MLDWEHGRATCVGCGDVLLLVPSCSYRRPGRRLEHFAELARQQGWRWLSEADRLGWHCGGCAGQGICGRDG